MIVTLLARTTIVSDAALKELGYEPHPKGTVSDADELIEVAGRECYQSWSRPNPVTATNLGYVANILSKRHFSVVEHPSFTFSVRQISRATSHELVRHRHLSFSQISQRYVDESDGEFITPPEVVVQEDVNSDIMLTDAHEEALLIYTRVVAELVLAGVPRKRARQAARAVLPNGHATRLIVSGNLAAWREMIQKRIARDNATGEPLADLEFHELAHRFLEILFLEAPSTMVDLWEEYGPVRESCCIAPLRRGTVDV